MHSSDEPMKATPTIIGEFDQIQVLIINQCEACNEAAAELENRLALILGDETSVSRPVNEVVSATCQLSSRLVDHLDSLTNLYCRIATITNSINI